MPPTTRSPPSPRGHVTVGSKAIPVAGPLVDDDEQPTKRTRRQKRRPETPEPIAKSYDPAKLKLWYVWERSGDGYKHVDCVYARDEEQARIELGRLRKSLKIAELVFTLSDQPPATETAAPVVTEERPDGAPAEAIRPGMFAEREGYFVAEVRGNAAFGVRSKTRDSALQFARGQVGPDAAPFTLVRPDDGTIVRKKLPVYPLGVQTAEDVLAAGPIVVPRPPLWNVHLGEQVGRMAAGTFVVHTYDWTAEDAIACVRERFPKYANIKLIAERRVEKQRPA